MAQILFQISAGLVSFDGDPARVIKRPNIKNYPQVIKRILLNTFKNIFMAVESKNF